MLQNTMKGDSLMTKKDMLAKMDEAVWGTDLDENSSYEEIKKEYEEMLEDRSDNSDMFPNGRAYDAEDEDGI